MSNVAASTEPSSSAKKVKASAKSLPKRTASSNAARTKGISRTDYNFWLDTSLLVVFSALVWVSTVIRFVFPPATSAQNWTLWSWSIDQWMGLQFVLLCVLTLGIVVHLMLHWTWICGVVTSRVWRGKDGKKRTLDDGTRTIYGVGFMIVVFNIMGLALAVAVLSVRSPI